MKTGMKRSGVIAAIVMGLLLSGLFAVDSGQVYAAVNPGKVSSMSLTVTGQPQANLEWKEATGKANGYTVVRNGKKIARISGKNALSYVDESLKPGKTYTYKVMPHYKNSKGKMTYGKASPARKVLKGYTYKKGSDGYMTLTGFTGRDETLTTPVKIGKVKVKRIGDSCFRGNVWIRKVVVSRGVSEIGDYAFEACGRMRGVTLPGSLRTIGDGAFNGCAQMRICDLPDNVTGIGKGAFLYCSHLGYVDLPKNLKTMGDFAFAGCERMTELTFNGTALTEIPRRAFCNCAKLDRVEIPASVKTIGKRAFSGCKILELCMIKGSASIGDYAFERCYPITIYTDDEKDSIQLGFGAFSSLTKGVPEGNEIRVNLPKDAEVAEGTFYGSRVDCIVPSQGDLNNYALEDGVLYSKDMKTLLAYFPKKTKGYGIVWSASAKAGELTVPDGVTNIAPYAFYGCKLKRVNLPDSLESIGHNAFTKSGVDKTMVYGGAGAAVDEKAFEDYEYSEIDPYADDDDDEGGNDGNDDADTGDDDSDVQPVETESYSFESLANEGIFDKQKFEGYLDIHEDFSEWIRKYIDFNKDNVPMTAEAMPYITMYSGDDHYRQMTSALNGEPFKTHISIIYSGDDYQDMYLMIDHGLFAELSRGRMPGDLLLYSGITPSRVSEIAGRGEQAEGNITDELREAIIARIGSETTDPGLMSTTASVAKAFEFSEGEFASKTIVMVYGSREALDRLGTISLDNFSQVPGEEEILFSANAKYRILDVGMVKEHLNTLDPVTGEIISTKETKQRTYVKLQLL